MSSGAALPVSPLAVPFPEMTPIAGCELAVARAGFYAAQRNDLLLMRFAPGTVAAGVFTRHAVGSAPVDWCKAHLAQAHRGVRAALINAGCANSFTGKAGYAAAERSAREVAAALGCGAQEVMLASTGVIGVLLDADKISRRIGELAAGQASWLEAARAIGTTDTFPKGAQATATIEGRPVRLAGIAKGSGMVAPNMATILAFIVTDAAVGAQALQDLVSALTQETFNAVTVDGDRSTNDTLLVFATGAAGGEAIERAGDPRLRDFKRALKAVMLDLALQLVRDGEGASKFVKIEVGGARSARSAQTIARSIAESPLVKTAFAGEDANWGRIVMAVGKADEPVDREKLFVAFGPHVAARDGAAAADYSEEAMSAYMTNAELEVRVDVGVGRGRATVWTCDLTKQYVAINGDYRS